LAIAAGAAAVAIAVGVAVPLGTPPATNPTALPEGLFINNPMPVNSNQSPGGGGGSLPDDGCGISSGRFDGGNSIKHINERKIKREEEWTLKDGNCARQKDENAFKRELENDQNWIRKHGTFIDNRTIINCTQLDGKCYRLLNSGPCRNQGFWFTLDPRTLKVRNEFLCLYFMYILFNPGPFYILICIKWFYRVDALHVFAEEGGSLSVKLDCAMTRKTPAFVVVEGNSSTQLTVIPFATVQSGSIPFLESKTNVSLFSLEVFPFSLFQFPISFSVSSVSKIILL